MMQNKTPVRKAIGVPPGTVLCHQRWRNTEITSEIGCRTRYDDLLQAVDFMPSDQIGIIFLTGGELVVDQGYRRRLVKLRKANYGRGVVLVDRSAQTTQQYTELQSFVSLDLGLTLIPVLSHKEAALVITQMAEGRSRPGVSPFLKHETRKPIIDQSMITCLCSLPGVGTTNAKKLLQKFKSVSSVFAASKEELKEVLGEAVAINVWHFIHAPTLY